MPLSEDAIAIIAAVQEATRDSTRAIEQRMDVFQEKQAQLFAGFPGSDPEAHRRYHEAVMEWRELRNKMVREALIHAAKVGGLGAACWVAYALWTVFKMEVTR